jgi:large subunit ribosomal protein L21
MYAVVETGGKQYRATPGEYVDVEKLPQDLGEQVTLDRVLLVVDGTDVKVGQPVVDGATVSAKVILIRKARKVTSFKYEQKKRIRTKTGHRQWFTRLMIESIQA